MILHPQAPRRPDPRPRIEALERPDKWYLGGLDGVVWAPPFPTWLHKPGFWDPVHLMQYGVAPCFTVALLNADGNEVALTPDGAGGAPPFAWRPDRLRARWRTGTGSASPDAGIATEDRAVRHGGILESEWTLPGEVRDGFLVAFTAQPAESASGFAVTGRGVNWIRRVADRAGKQLAVGMEISGPRSPAWTRILPSEGAGSPVWALSPFAEEPAANAGHGANDPAPHTTGIREVPQDGRTGWIWVAVAFRAPVATERHVLRMRLTPRLEESRASDPDTRHPKPDTRHPEPDARTPAPTWESFFAGFPAFASSDPFLDRYFDYRIFGLGLNRIEGRWGHVRHPAIAEGPEYFHVPITYSAQCHMMEMRWRDGGREAWGSILNFLDNQKEDGSLHGRLYPNHLERTDFYHANWGDAVLAVHRMHPGREALARCYQGLSRYARWLCRSRDPEESGMFTVVNHFETGQEYMSRYMAVDPEADVRGWQPRLQLKGIDVTVYAHQLFVALGTIARELGRVGDEAEWRRLATRSGDAITGRMWSPGAGLFTDVDGRTFERTGVKAAIGFYPMLTDLVDGARLDAMMDHLDDPATFGTRFPLPSSSVDDPRFSAEGIWRGKRRNCPWNGRVWPMTTSHVIEGLLRCWRRGNERAGELAADMIPRFVRMMFSDGDLERPNCFEHYNPDTGRACYHRGIDDYQHSWVLDLIARGIAGLRVGDTGLEVRPLPHGLPHVSMGPVRTRGRDVSVELAGSRVTLVVDGERYDGVRGELLHVDWEDMEP